MPRLFDRPIFKRAILLVPILLLAFFLRLDELGNWPVRFDEAFSVWLSNMDFANFTERTAKDVHPPPITGSSISGRGS